MREQDKALFLQLIKLHSTIKEIRSDMKFMEENCDCSFDSIDGPASYWCELSLFCWLVFCIYATLECTDFARGS